MIPLKIAGVLPPHRHSREGTSPRTTIRGGNPSSTISHAMKIGSGKPVVGATLVVARPRRQPIFIPLCGLHKAMVIPNAAKRSEESKVLAVLDTASNQNGPMTTTEFLGFLPAISAPSAVNPHAHSRPSLCRRHPAKWRPLITRNTGEGRYPEGRGLRMTRCQFDAQERMAYHVFVAETTPGRRARTSGTV